MDDFFVFFKEVGPKQWLAATAVAPYFCFEADSRERAEELATRALRDFHEKFKKD
jgi:hypothetical protein